MTFLVAFATFPNGFGRLISGRVSEMTERNNVEINRLLLVQLYGECQLPLLKLHMVEGQVQCDTVLLRSHAPLVEAIGRTFRAQCPTHARAIRHHFRKLSYLL